MDFCNEHLKKTLRWSGSTLKNTNTLVFPVPLFCVFFFFFRWASLYLWLCLLGLLEPMTSITGSYASATTLLSVWSAVSCAFKSICTFNRSLTFAVLFAEKERDISPFQLPCRRSYFSCWKIHCREWGAQGIIYGSETQKISVCYVFRS